MIKKVSIVYNQSLTQIQGINYVNNSFVMGGKYFAEHGLLLDKIYAPDTVFDCTKHNHLFLIGSNVNTLLYKRQRKLRVFLREIFSSNYLLGASIKMYLNFTYNAKKAINNLIKSNDDSDFIIFQDMDSARQYFRRVGKNDKVKTILLLHCSNHPLEQAETVFPGFYKYPKLKAMAYRRCEETMHLVDKVVYLSEHAVNASLLPAKRKTYVFNGVEDLEKITVTPPSRPLQFVIVASVTYHKGQLIIIEALSLLSQEILSKLHLTIVGGGNEFELCQQLVKDKKLENVITMTGRRNDVAEILKGMDVFILPSLSEGMPMSILEAMRQGLYIMATPVGGIPEMIEPEYGEFIQRDPQTLADAIKHVVDRRIIGFEAKQKSRERFVSDFTLKKMIERYSNTLLSL